MLNQVQHDRVFSHSISEIYTPASFVKQNLIVSRRLTKSLANEVQHQRGGAIYTSNSYITIEGSTFSSNTVTIDNGNGGAVYLYNSTLNISSCTFSSNTANSVTNTIYVEDEDSSLTIEGVSVSENPWNPE